MNRTLCDICIRQNLTCIKEVGILDKGAIKILILPQRAGTHFTFLK